MGDEPDEPDEPGGREGAGPDGRVLQVVTSTDRRGAEVAATQLGAELTARGRSIDTVALWPGSGGARLDLATLGRRRRDPRALTGLIARSRRSSLVIGHGSATLPFGAAACSVARTPFVYRSIGDPAYWATSAMRRNRVRAALARARLVVALWPAAAEILRRQYGLAAERVVVIPTGVPADSFSPTSPAERPAARRALGGQLDIDIDPELALVAWIGALSPEKDPLLAVEAVVARPGLQLVMAGAGPLQAEVVARAAAVAPGRVWCVGPVADPSPVLAAADALVLPSRSEGIPAVAIEAGLAGLPVVATPVGGIPEVVVDGETGVLIDGRSATAMGDALWSVVSGPGEAMGAAARQRCTKRFSLDLIVAAWAGLLDELTSTVRRR